MKRLATALAVLLTVAAGCGASSAPRPAATTPHCNPALGRGTMGICSPTATVHPKRTLVRGATLIPDVSEFQGCALHSEAIFRVYEAGTNRQDSRAGCHASELHRKQVWSGAYAFLRGSRSCVYEADRTVAIVNSLGGVDVIVGDSETGLRGGFDRCFKHEVERLGYPEVEYTCPGCGDEQIPPVWVASYPTRPAGTWVAHQFSEAFLCRGVFGDCSVNEGILAIHRVNRAALIRRRDHLRRVLSHYGCRARVRRHEHLGPRCLRWFREGNRINAELAA